MVSKYKKLILLCGIALVMLGLAVTSIWWVSKTISDENKAYNTRISQTERVINEYDNADIDGIPASEYLKKLEAEQSEHNTFNSILLLSIILSTGVAGTFLVFSTMREIKSIANKDTPK